MHTNAYSNYDDYVHMNINSFIVDYIDKTLCGLDLSKQSFIARTIDVITCPDCLAIIRECKELDLVPQESTATFKNDRVVYRCFDKRIMFGTLFFNTTNNWYFGVEFGEILTESRSVAITAKLRELNAKKGQNDI